MPDVIVSAIHKVADRRLVIGWAMLATEKAGKPYVDTQDEHIPQQVILDSALDFMLNSRKSDDMHDESPVGQAAFAWPSLDAMPEEFRFPSEKRGLGVIIQYPQQTFDKFLSGEYTGFSIGGFATAKAMPDGMCPGCEKPAADCACKTQVQKAKKYTSLKLNFISAVTVPAQTPAIAVAVIKSGQPPEKNAMDPAKLALLLALTGPQFEVYKSLGSDRQNAFLDMTVTERDGLVQKAADADPVVHTCKDGTKIRKSMGEVVFNMAKSNDLLLERLDRQEAETKAAKYATVARTEFGHLALDEAETVEMLVALDGIQNPEKREKIRKAISAVNEANRGATTVLGVNGNKPIVTRKNGQTAEDAYNDGVEKHSKVQKVSLAAAYIEFPKTQEGAPLYEAYMDEREAREHGR